MLHEILLSLSGFPSPIWDQVRKADNDENEKYQEHISAPEQAMLRTLAEISELHIQIKHGAATVSASHTSLTCRAVGMSISTIHLRAFREKILDVEASVLNRDAAYVGGYDIVPLSTIVANFAPWTRKLHWLAGIVTYIQDGGSRKTKQCSTADIITHLGKETLTGYSDIEEMAINLLSTAQETWMRSVSVWVLYGTLPSAGANDFMIGKTTGLAYGQCALQSELVPSFITSETAETILAIGNALVQLRLQGSRGKSSQKSISLISALLPASLAELRTLSYPLTSSMLGKVMFAINQLISKTALSHLLPIESILDILEAIQQFILLGRGEFALYLIQNAENCLSSRQLPNTLHKPVRKLGLVENLSVKESELASILSRTWSDILSLQPEDENDGRILSLTKSMLELKPIATSALKIEAASVLSTLLPTPTILQLTIAVESPLTMFISPTDIKQYAFINAYLLSLRRAQIRLSDLWKLTSHRRCHPAPLRPPVNANTTGCQALATCRNREDKRNSRMRSFWSSASKSHFVLSEIGNYFHGEVILNSWEHFRSWLETVSAIVQSDNSSPQSSKVISSDSSSSTAATNDPRTLAQAHRSYLQALQVALQLNDNGFIKTSRDLCATIDHFVALFVRLQTIWHGLDLQEDNGIEDAFHNYGQDEKDVLAEMERTSVTMDQLLQAILTYLTEAERERGITEMTSGMATIGQSRHDDCFVPWDARTLDRLIMKLDFLNDNGGRSREDGAGLLGVYEDDA